MDNVLLILLAGAWIGVTKGGLGGPIGGLLILPLLSQTMDVDKAVGLILPLLMFADLFAMRFYWRLWDMRYIKLLLPAAVGGILIGTLMLASLPNDVLRPMLGILILLVIGYKFTSDRLKNIEYSPRDWHGYLAGWASGLGSALANAGGPPITAYLLFQKIAPTTFVGTVTLFFFIVNILKVPGYIVADILDVEEFIRIAWMLPIIPIGVWVGRQVVGWINPKIFENIMVAALVIASLSLIF